MASLVMAPGPGERVLRFVGDRLLVTLEFEGGRRPPAGWTGFLRTNLGRGARLNQEIIHAHTGKLGLAASSWRDIPMEPTDRGWQLTLALAEPGYFHAKAYAADEQHRQHWPEGSDLGVGVHPDHTRTGNTLYCAFPRMFGRTKELARTDDAGIEAELERWDDLDYTVIPPSGTFRDLIRELPHIFDTLGCRILHLLPVNPTPTTYARFGRFGSPYAGQDLLAIDPALVEFDRRTTGVDQFRELTDAVHSRGGRVFLDVVINHTGWGSTLQETHPEWFVRDPDGDFHSPGAWGVTWEDLVELDHRNPKLWELLGDMFLEWCRRGVDGFRCDAGYKIPVPAWRYITARVREAFPDTVFLLEGLGGAWEVTEQLLTDGGMHWAYSELFQNYSAEEISGYLDYALAQSRDVGLYFHYSETHDNERLAAKGRDWSLLRNRLCALASVQGGFGFTCGVEWLAREKLNVHQSRGLSWNRPESIIPQLAALNRLLLDHPCFFDHAALTRLSPPDAAVLALGRVSAEGRDAVLVLVNTDLDQAHTISIPKRAYESLDRPAIDLLSHQTLKPASADESSVVFHVEPGAGHCLASTERPRGLAGDDYRSARSQAAWAVAAVSHRLAIEHVGPFEWRELARLASRDPRAFLGAVQHLDPAQTGDGLVRALERQIAANPFPLVTVWQAADIRRITPVPPSHWFLIEDTHPFRARLKCSGDGREIHLASIQVGDRHVACARPGLAPGDTTIELERRRDGHPRVTGVLRVLHAHPDVSSLALSPDAVAHGDRKPPADGMALLTNGRGGMARLHLDLGRVTSKYDCVLGANLHPNFPVDRHLLVKSLRAWLVADGFVTPLDRHNCLGFTPGPPAEWRFAANAGDGRVVEIRLTADMTPGRNETVFAFHRPTHPPPFGRDLPGSARVSLIVRLDLLDRNFHFESKRNEGADHHFTSRTRVTEPGDGFEFAPAPDRGLRARASLGRFHSEPEWRDNIHHPIEQSRGQADREDVWSPGWFELPLAPDARVELRLDAEPSGPSQDSNPSPGAALAEDRARLNRQAVERSGIASNDPFGQRLALAVQAFVVRRNDTKTVIAGYPWFLDWGRDSLICARGMLAAGMTEEVLQLLVTFGRFAQHGTIPNSIHGEDASNRDTSDAPLWYGIVAEEAAALLGESVYTTRVDGQGRDLRDVLLEIGRGYRAGTPNGIRVDPDSGLVWSPSHFTWMDTNYPAATPRQGYPIEIQAMWIRLCRQLHRLGVASDGEAWNDLADRASNALQSMFWLDEPGWYADLLVADPGRPAAQAVPDNALRSNLLFPISLGLVPTDRARRVVEAAARHLVVPGALRSLAPLPVSPSLPVLDPSGRLLNQPDQPYWGQYEGDEDTRRKPAYHNGTAWTWTFPVYCEALARAWESDPDALATARILLGSMDRLLTEGCLGQLPEIVDGDAPHAQRGCDAQAWGATEALRVWKLLQAPS